MFPLFVSWTAPAVPGLHTLDAQIDQQSIRYHICHKLLNLYYGQWLASLLAAWKMTSEFHWLTDSKCLSFSTASFLYAFQGWACKDLMISTLRLRLLIPLTVTVGITIVCASKAVTILQSVEAKIVVIFRTCSKGCSFWFTLKIQNHSEHLVSRLSFWLGMSQFDVDASESWFYHQG